MLQIHNYSKSYGIEAILSFDKKIFDRGMYLIQGVNGSGKTTLFKSIAGIIQFDGDCLIDEVSLKNNPVSYRKRVNYCEAEPMFPGFLTGQELVSFVAKTMGESIMSLKELIKVFGIDQYWKNQVSTYSSGMLKKLALTMAFCGRPRLILLDEPFTTIDIKSLSLLCDLIRDFHGNGCSFIISAHQVKSSIPIDFDNTLVIENRTLQIC